MPSLSAPRAGTMFAQTEPAQAGYRFPEPLEVAPGQIAMITLRGIGRLTQPNCTDPPHQRHGRDAARDQPCL